MIMEAADRQVYFGRGEESREAAWSTKQTLALG